MNDPLAEAVMLGWELRKEGLTFQQKGIQHYQMFLFIHLVLATVLL